MESVHLHGADAVASAARTISGAASEMNTAAYNIECGLQRHRDFLDDWLYRFQAALEEHALKVASPLLPAVPASLREEDPEPAPPPDKRSYKERRVDNMLAIVSERRTVTRRGDDEIPF